MVHLNSLAHRVSHPLTNNDEKKRILHHYQAKMTIHLTPLRYDFAALSCTCRPNSIVHVFKEGSSDAVSDVSRYIVPQLIIFLAPITVFNFVFHVSRTCFSDRRCCPQFMEMRPAQRCRGVVDIHDHRLSEHKPSCARQSSSRARSFARVEYSAHGCRKGLYYSAESALTTSLLTQLRSGPRNSAIHCWLHREEYCACRQG